MSTNHPLFRRIFFPGIVPLVGKRILSLPLPDAARKLFEHPAGLLTIHFWAPTFKWAISGGNMMDFNRPVDQMSMSQQMAVAATGLIWSRYSFVIVPVNYNLFLVNIVMGFTGLYQLFRCVRYKMQTQS